MKPENQLPILCKNLQYLRESHNLSKEQMAKLLGVGMQAMNSVELGVCPPSLGVDNLYRACRHFDFTLKDLFAPLE